VSFRTATAIGWNKERIASEQLTATFPFTLVHTQTTRYYSFPSPSLMESLDLNTLASSLPTANLANAEKDLLNNFKGEHMHLTHSQRCLTHHLSDSSPNSRCSEHHHSLQILQTNV
jgi:hypothetical protein